MAEAWLVVDPADTHNKDRMEDQTPPLSHAKNLENWGNAQHLKWEHAINIAQRQRRQRLWLKHGW